MQFYALAYHFELSKNWTNSLNIKVFLSRIKLIQYSTYLKGYQDDERHNDTKQWVQPSLKFSFRKFYKRDENASCT